MLRSLRNMRIKAFICFLTYLLLLLIKDTHVHELHLCEASACQYNDNKVVAAAENIPNTISFFNHGDKIYVENEIENCLICSTVLISRVCKSLVLTLIISCFITLIIIPYYALFVKKVKTIRGLRAPPYSVL